MYGGGIASNMATVASQKQTSIRQFLTVRRCSTVVNGECILASPPTNTPKSTRHAALGGLRERTLNAPRPRTAIVTNRCKIVEDVIVIDESENEEEERHKCSKLRRSTSPAAVSPPTRKPHSPDMSTNYSLPLVVRPRHGAHSAFGTISGATLARLLFSLPREQFRRKFVLVDCRYPYEYAGGHVTNAVNICDKRLIVDFFFPANQRKFAEISGKIPLFYCEYSQQRGPGMALELRKVDRARNEHRYPDVDYREIYVLEEGYRKFFMDNKFMEFCEPAAYTPMIHADHIDELKRYRQHCRKRGAGAQRDQPRRMSKTSPPPPPLVVMDSD